MALIYLILGGNTIDKATKLIDAVALLGDKLGQVVHLSSVYETAAWGYESSESYLNQVVSVETTCSPFQVLAITQKIEKYLGRLVKTVNNQYADRPIDIDILFYDHDVVESDRLTIPHPRIAERRFVLEPLNAVCPDYIHPLLKLSVREMLAECSDDLDVCIV